MWHLKKPVALKQIQAVASQGRVFVLRLGDGLSNCVWYFDSVVNPEDLYMQGDLYNAVVTYHSRLCISG